jgi:hypothetical protein
MDKKELPLHSGKMYLVPFWWGNGVKRAKSYPILVLNAKGGEIKAKENGSANHLWILKIVELEFVFHPKSSNWKIWSLMGENIDYGKKGEFLALDQFYSWNISLFAQTSVFDLEIGKRSWFAKTNQVVAKVIQICQILRKENLVFNLHF